MSRGDAHPLITGFSNAVHKACETLAEAEKYMKDSGVTSYEYEIKCDPEETIPIRGRTAYYAVANGRTPGVRDHYK